MTWQRNYGYLWWLNEFGGFNADGWGGQYIFVFPDKDLVVVMTAGLGDKEREGEVDYLRRYILPSVKSDQALPAREGGPSLASRLEELARPQPARVPPVPAIAEGLSGRTYHLDPSPLQWTSVSASFPPGDEGWFEIAAVGVDKTRFPVGLDGVFRLTQTPYGKMGAQGRWVDGQTFELKLLFVESGDLQTGTFTFTEEKLGLRFSTSLSGPVAALEGRRLD
jgi:hypothetical protein